MIISSTVTVGTSPTLLSEHRASGDTGAPLWVEISVPSGGATIYLGGATVDTTHGRPVSALESFAFQCVEGDSLYAVVAASTQAVTVFEGGK